ncbi:sensor domain-containing diguanylate cyclase [Terrihalobacillus insolitus]|uniref:sensor domain-containing diguanylate cyclase n=1 Tax=Terrihalobacillus insolitus TaxID=2950438 RepID=UPI00233FCCEE|nr:sensor domain-containing diguanylate cyclase [Terrihalobacillus insolitus]MDC3412926.1 sensor domain-containing diguanylate cyclase [Terrihalobacillus insolitus]
MEKINKESTITESIERTLDNMEVLTKSLSCKLISMEGPWHVCRQRCEFSNRVSVAASSKVQEYLATEKEIHILDETAMQTLHISYGSSSDVLYLPLSFESTHLGALLLEYEKSESALKNWDKHFFTSVGTMTSLAIGNALKACMLSILEHVNHLFSEQMELQERLQMIIEGTRQVFGDEYHSEIFLYDPVDQLLELNASTLAEEKKWSDFTTSAESGLNGWVIQHNQMIGVSDVNADARANQDHAKLNRIKSIGIAPIENNGRILGVIDLFSSKKKEFSSEELWVLNMLAQHAGIAIADALAYHQMKEMAMIDPVTGCFSRQYFETRSMDEVSKALRNGHMLSVLMLDIDHFKQVNDTLGHQTGDRILRQVTSVIQNNIRTSDICARYGGEEFIVLLPQVSQPAANRIAERILQRVKKETDPSVTISIGIASLHSSNTSMEELVEQADKALYYSKEHGRDQVSIYENVHQRVQILDEQ